MTRKEVEENYTIENGMIASPGMFEGEAAYLPVFYDVYLDGFATEGRDGVLSVEVTREDKAEWPELRRRKRVRFVVDDYGFVKEVVTWGR